jgi:hypothetical protein
MSPCEQFRAWDLSVVAHERDAWIRRALAADSPELDR